jgi:hypothetical protein
VEVGVLMNVIRVKHKLVDVRSVSDFRNWLNTVVDVKVKAIFLTGLLATFTVVGFQYQVDALTNQRLDASCAVRIEARESLRNILFDVTDLSDVLPDNPQAEAYRINRWMLINDKYPLVTEEECV